MSRLRITPLLTASLLVPAVITAQQSDTAPALVLNAAPQNKAVFLSWSTLPAATYSVRWRPAGVGQWTIEPETPENFFEVDSLTNGKAYDFQVAAKVRGDTLLSLPAEMEPQRRNDCVDAMRQTFCTQDSFLYEAAKWTNLGAPLVCGGRFIEISDLMPDCLYRAGSKLLLLDRYSGSRFIPPRRIPDPDLVRRVLLRTIWGTEDFERVKAQARESVSDLPNPSRGAVDTTAAVKSYLIRVTPQLYSRLTWFARPRHEEGRYAIVQEGHAATAIVGSSDMINWFLRNGWQVLALDMPLEGVNSIDQRFPMFAHADFDAYESGEQNPLQWFFSPVVAAMELIYEDAHSKEPPTVLMIGRSGGGWTTALYSAMDHRVNVAVNVAGGSPASTHLSYPTYSPGLPDYEQVATKLYDQVSMADILLAAGSDGDFFFYSSNDPCCHRFTPTHPWIRYLEDLSTNTTGKAYRVFLSTAKLHGLTSEAFSALGEYLRELGIQN